MGFGLSDLQIGVIKAIKIRIARDSINKERNSN